jgi:hypothetical protein
MKINKKIVHSLHLMLLICFLLAVVLFMTGPLYPVFDVIMRVVCGVVTLSVLVFGNSWLRSKMDQWISQGGIAGEDKS